MKILKLFTTIIMLAGISPQPRKVDAQWQQVLQVVKSAIPELVQYFKELDDNELKYSYKYDTSNPAVIITANEKESGVVSTVLDYTIAEQDKWTKQQVCSFGPHFDFECAGICSKINDPKFDRNAKCSDIGYERVDSLCYPVCKDGYQSFGNLCRKKGVNCDYGDGIFNRIGKFACESNLKLFGNAMGDTYSRESKDVIFCPSNLNLITGEKNEKKFYIGDLEIKKWTQISFTYDNGTCKIIVDNLRSRFGDKNDITFKAVYDAVAHASEDKSDICSVNREVKINVEEAKPYLADFKAINLVDQGKSRCNCRVYATTELNHHFVPNIDLQKQRSKDEL